MLNQLLGNRFCLGSRIAPVNSRHGLPLIQVVILVLEKTHHLMVDIRDIDLHFGRR